MGKDAPKADFQAVRGESGIREASVQLPGITINLCQVHGIANVRKVIKNVQNKTKNYHVIEVMACPNGCINGGGQPITYNPIQTIQERISGVYNRDKSLQTTSPQDNQNITDIYEKWLGGKPASEEAHHMLHTSYYKRPKHT